MHADAYVKSKVDGGKRRMKVVEVSSAIPTNPQSAMTKLTAQRALDAPGLESSKDFDGQSHVAIIIYAYILRMSWVWGMLTS